MRVSYVNLSGRLEIETKALVPTENRAFRYGDALFETMLWTNGTIRLVDYHVDRLQQSLNSLHIEGGSKFNREFLIKSAKELIDKNDWTSTNCRLRLQVYRGGAGLYSPVSNQAEYVLSGTPILEESSQLESKTGLIVDLFTDHYKPASSLSMLKSTNSLVFVLAGLYRKRKGLDEVIILNQEGLICESLSSNIFISYDQKLYTPALSEGCVAGVMRRKTLEIAQDLDIEIVEAKIDPQILKDADEVFLTNAIRGIQWVMGYQQKRYFKRWSKTLQQALNTQ